MATAAPSTRTVTKTVEEEITDGVVLTLTDAEAETLCEISYYIGGVPSTSRRGHLENISRALYAAGIAGPGFEAGDKSIGYVITFVPSEWSFDDLPEGSPARQGLPTY